MIKSVQLTNFRRHADVDLRFDDSSQLILIAGSNGAGKSSILEGIVFALYGEGRHGRKHLDRLTKRGRELEGMSAEVVFTVGQDEYRVHRRRDGKSSTAVLYVNDIPLVEGPVQVTTEVANVLGMDSTGFRLAVIAQQKDLDGLASLRPAERAQMIARLLRLDAVTAAKGEAQAAFRRERELATGLRGTDLEALDTRLKELTEQATAAQEELTRADQSLTLLDAELAATSDVEGLWNASMRNVARAQGALEQSRAQIATQRAELEALTVPEEPKTTLDILALSEKATVLERAIAQAEQQAQLAEQRRHVEAELGTIREKIAAAQTVADAGAPALEPLNAAVSSAQATVQSASATLTALRVEQAASQALLAAAQTRLDQADALQGQCDSCGQEITEDHREQHLAESQARVNDLQRVLDDLRVRIDQASTDERSATEDLTRAQQHRDDAAKSHDLVERAREALAELKRREATYQSQLDRVPDGTVDLDQLYAQKGALAIETADARKAAELQQKRATVLAQRDSLRTRIETAEKELPTLEEAVNQAQPAADLRGRYEERQLTLEGRRAEEEIAQHWRTQVAVLNSALKATEDHRAEAAAVAERQAQHQQAAVAAGAASRLLGDVGDRLTTQIRPTLEGAISALLSTMSEGRFAAVKVTPDYDITVHDDGEWRTLSELSGGETDLVALATRLALSQVVADRHGAGGAGFLILDECFGSQDPQRRASILDALRNLRDTYDQIFLISHVENIEDAADMVVSVQSSEDREETEVLVA